MQTTINSEDIMVDVLDLRVGNYIYYSERSQFPMKILSISHDGYITLDFDGNNGMPWDSDVKNVQGIPLSDELMRRLGFSLSVGGLWQKREQGRSIRIKIESEFLFIEAFDDRLLDSRGNFHGIKYLHQLQNAFKAISKQELKIESL